MAKWEMTDVDLAEQITQAQRAGKDMMTRPIAIQSVEYMPTPLRRIGVTFKNGTTFFFPVSLLRELRDATDEQLAHVAITPLRDALEWETLDVAVNIPGLLSDLLGITSPATMRYLPARPAVPVTSVRKGARLS
jgi:hypothetical protein